jgi:hypothetical protein
MFSRSNFYETGETSADTFERINKKLASELRSHIRTFAVVEPHCADWRAIADSVHQVAMYANFERPVHESSSPSSAGGQPPSFSSANSSSTSAEAGEKSLWEGDALTVRYVLEEGKLNIVLRMMVDYAAFGAQDAQYVQDIGFLVLCCVSAIEGCQTVDMPLLMEYCAHMVLGCVHGQKDVGDVQVTNALLYLAAVANKMERMGAAEGLVVDMMVQYAIARAVTEILDLDKDSKKLGQNALLACAQCLARLCGHERYKGNELSFWGLQDAEGKAAKDFVAGQWQKMNAALVTRLGTLDPSRKAELRPMLDAVLKSKYYKPKS